MKRVKIMLSAILVLAIVAGALAFKVKSPDVCAYTKIVAAAPTTTNCDRVSNANNVVASTFTTITAPTGSTLCATTTPSALDGDKCPLETVQCPCGRTLAVE